MAYPMRWVARPSPVSCGSSSGPPTARSSPMLARSTTARPTRRSSSASTPSRAAGARDNKVLANYFPLALKPNIMSWLMHLRVDSISSWSDWCHEFVGAFTGGHQAHGQASDLHIIPRRKVKPCGSTYRGSAGRSKTSQMFIQPPLSAHSIRMCATARCVKSWR